MTALPTRALGYARISRPDEREILANQVQAIRAHASGLEIVLEDVLEETASGGKDDRVAFNELLSRVEGRGGPKLVIFTSLSRMTRGGVASALYVLNRLERAGVGWHFTDQSVLNYDSTTPKLVKDIILAVLAAVDEDYRRNISVKTRAAYARRKALAEAQGIPLRWGRRGKGKRVPPATTSETAS
jgi:DNA invertase Pin-like site-specific DNA recombinase